jgi:CRISPR-associated protein Csb1
MSVPNLNRLREFVANDAALRRRQTLQPVGGKGDKIFPPTYPPSDEAKRANRNAPPRHVYEKRRLETKDVWCVLIDSVQSQANRLEECLLQAVESGVPIPHVVVDFSRAGLEGISKITSLDAPHRVYDAILRDSLLGTEPFMNSTTGKRLAKAKAEDASALLEISPTALLFGAWHSTGEGGGLGAKFARCLISEIVGVNVPMEELTNQRTGEIDVRTAGRRTGSRIDPAGILKDVKIYRSAESELDWTPHEKQAAKDKSGNPILYSRKKGDKAGKPSVINHGNITPSVQPLGVTCDRVEHTFVLSFAALRRLRFGDAGKDSAGRTLLTALGLVALAEQDERGYALRSRCDLVCEGRAPLELVHPDGVMEPVLIDRTTARNLYKEAFETAKSAGFALSAEPLRLTPQDKLVEIVRRSQELALLGAGGDDEEPGDDK